MNKLNELPPSDPQTAVPRRLLEDVRKWAPPGNIMLMQAIDQLAQALADAERPYWSPPWVEGALTDHLRKLGCRCERPLIGYSSGYGPRCRLCNVDAERPQEEEQRSDWLVRHLDLGHTVQYDECSCGATLWRATRGSQEPEP